MASRFLVLRDCLISTESCTQMFLSSMGERKFGGPKYESARGFLIWVGDGHVVGCYFMEMAYFTAVSLDYSVHVLGSRIILCTLYIKYYAEVLRVHYQYHQQYLETTNYSYGTRLAYVVR